MSKFDILQNSKSSKSLEPQISKAPEQKQMGRPKAKHSDRENYHQTTIYIARPVFSEAKAKLLKQGGGEMSALVERLLQEWVTT